MNYELAKQLKENGYIGAVDLSSLVEACGDRFRWLGRRQITFNRRGKTIETRIEWESQAKGIKTKTDKGLSSTKDIKIFHCETPEEAVAKLWLELNKK